MAVYKEQTELFRIPLYLIMINGEGFNNIERVIDALDEKGCLLAETRAAFDVEREYDEIEHTLQPIIYPSFDVYNGKTEVVYVYTKQKDVPDGDRLLINDMNVLSKHIVISEDTIVSPQYAQPFGECDNYGFRFFCDYYLDDICEVGKWTFEYKKADSLFTISFAFDSDNNDGEKNLVEIYRKKTDKSDSYKMLIYAIKKLCKNPKETGLTFYEDNFDVKTYTKAQF